MTSFSQLHKESSNLDTSCRIPYLSQDDFDYIFFAKGLHNDWLNADTVLVKIVTESDFVACALHLGQQYARICPFSRAVTSRECNKYSKLIAAQHFTFCSSHFAFGKIITRRTPRIVLILKFDFNF